MTNFTETTEGLIQHLPHPEHGFDMPVKLKTEPHKTIPGRRTVVANGKGLPEPLMIDGRYVYALHGGGEYVV